MNKEDLLHSIGELIVSGKNYIKNVSRETNYRTSQTGIELIKSFEGCRLNAYKAVPSEKYYTIGYGHYGADVDRNMVITREYAESLLKSDLQIYEDAVTNVLRTRGLEVNQNQFDALVSFTYNCGSGNLKTLTGKNRNLQQIGDALLLYNKSGGKVLKGLQRRREAERELFFS